MSPVCVVEISNIRNYLSSFHLWKAMLKVFMLTLWSLFNVLIANKRSWQESDHVSFIYHCCHVSSERTTTQAALKLYLASLIFNWTPFLVSFLLTVNSCWRCQASAGPSKVSGLLKSSPQREAISSAPAVPMNNAELSTVSVEHGGDEAAASFVFSCRSWLDALTLRQTAGRLLGLEQTGPESAQMRWAPQFVGREYVPKKKKRNKTPSALSKGWKCVYKSACLPSWTNPVLLCLSPGGCCRVLVRISCPLDTTSSVSMPPIDACIDPLFDCLDNLCEFKHFS